MLLVLPPNKYVLLLDYLGKWEVISHGKLHELSHATTELRNLLSVATSVNQSPATWEKAETRRKHAAGRSSLRAISDASDDNGGPMEIGLFFAGFRVSRRLGAVTR